MLACAATGAFVGCATWRLRRAHLADPGSFGRRAISGSRRASYPHPVVAAPPFTRVALLPAFQPLALRGGGGDGADPDAHVYPGGVATLNEYFPTYPVDMALARYEQTGDDRALRALASREIVPRPWLVSQRERRNRLGRNLAAPTVGHGGIGSPVTSPAQRRSCLPAIRPRRRARRPARRVRLFFGDAGGFAPVVLLRAERFDRSAHRLDRRAACVRRVSPRSRRAWAAAHAVAPFPFRIEPTRGCSPTCAVRLPGGPDAACEARASFAGMRFPSGVSSVTCAGLCELVAQTRALPELPRDARRHMSPLRFREICRGSIRRGTRQIRRTAPTIQRALRCRVDRPRGGRVCGTCASTCGKRLVS